MGRASRVESGWFGEEPREDAREPLTVSEFVTRARRAIESSLSNFAVEGELGRFDRYASGHCYFSIKDDSAQLSCVMFRRHASGLEQLPKVGDRVRIEGSGSVYEPRGQLQFIAVSLKPAGRGGLYEQFLRLKAKLEAEGLFDRARKRPVPKWPACVGVVTSPEGAAVQDVLRTLRKRMPVVPVIVYPTLTQGEMAPAQIVAALGRASERAECDTIILCRGGGSMEDLWAYNDEGVARAIAACPIPVVTGIGHEIDETIADHVADERTPTPTAAAARSVPDRAEVMRILEAQVRRLVSRSIGQHDRMVQRLDYAARRLRHPRQVLERQQQLLRACVSRLLSAPRQRLHAQKAVLDSMRRGLRHPRSALGMAAGALGRCASRMRSSSGGRIRTEGARVDSLSRLLARQGTVLGALSKDLGGLERRLGMGARTALGNLASALENRGSRLSALDHRRTLARGFSLVRDPQGDLVRDSKAVPKGARVSIQFARGGAEAEIKKLLADKGG